MILLYQLICELQFTNDYLIYLNGAHLGRKLSQLKLSLPHARWTNCKTVLASELVEAAAIIHKYWKYLFSTIHL